MRRTNYDSWEPRQRAAAVVVALVIVACFMAAAAHIAYVNYGFAVDAHQNVEKASQAGTPEEMTKFLHEARDGLRENGYGGGQWAYVLQTPATNTTVTYRILDSYIERAERLARDNNETRASIGMNDMRKSLAGVGAPDSGDEGGFGIDTTGWWAHQDPLRFVWLWAARLSGFISVAVLFFGGFAAVDNDYREDAPAWFTVPVTTTFVVLAIASLIIWMMALSGPV